MSACGAILKGAPQSLRCEALQRKTIKRLRSVLESSQSFFGLSPWALAAWLLREA
jgi:Iap family predicted aminopeptidase